MADQMSEKVSEQPKEGEENESKKDAPPGMNPQMSTKPSGMPVVVGPARGRRGGGCTCLGRPCVGLCWRCPIYPKVGAQDWRDQNFGRALGAEFLGTMLLVFFGVLSVFVSGVSGPDPNQAQVIPEMWFIDEDGTNHTFWQIAPVNPNKLHVSLAFGFAVATIAQALGHVSGAHLNPAVSFGLMIACRTTVVTTVCYIVVQCIGAIVGTLLVWLTTKVYRIPADPPYKATGKIAVYGDVWHNWGMGATVLGAGEAQFPDGMMTEFTLTFLLVFTVVAVTDEERTDIKGSAPLAIGLAVFCAHAAGMYFTGSSVNPARSFGPAIFSDAEKRWIDHWVYWIGPLLGGFEGGFWYMTIFSERKAPPPPGPSVAPSVITHPVTVAPSVV